MAQSSSSSSTLTAAAEAYAAQLDGTAVDYLISRGLDEDACLGALLGSVVEPMPGHEPYVGMLCLPYVTRCGVKALKFRALDGSTPKYRWPSGQGSRMYNTRDLFKAGDEINVCEGEIDTLTLSYMVGLPTVGIPGVQHWKEHHARLLDGYSVVRVWADNDAKEDGSNPGMDLARRIRDDLPQTQIVTLGLGEDVNSAFVEKGADYLTSKID